MELSWHTVEYVWGRKKMKNYIDIEELKEFIIWYIDHVINDNEFNNTNIKIINEIIIDAVVSEFNFIKDDTKDHITYNVIDGIINVIIEDTVNILKAVSLKKITMEQIAVMEPKEIHDLFNSFAGDFFKKLYLYGGFGAVFGINLWNKKIFLNHFVQSGSESASF